MGGSLGRKSQHSSKNSVRPASSGRNWEDNYCNFLSANSETRVRRGKTEGVRGREGKSVSGRRRTKEKLVVFWKFVRKCKVKVLKWFTMV